MDISRRYDIDWIRVIAIGLLLIYHIAIVFQPWGTMIAFITSQESMESIWVPMSMLNVWRIPLLFFVSGMGVNFAMRKRNWWQLIKERSLRILLPYIAGIFLIVPLHMFLFQDYYNTDLNYLPNPGHLWFLGNIFIYTLVLSPLFLFLKSKSNNGFQNILKKLYGNPFGPLLTILPLSLEALILNPQLYELYAITSHGFWLGLIAFFFGFSFVYAGEKFWTTVRKWKWFYLAIGLITFLTRYSLFDLRLPNYMMPIETVTWVLAVLGFGNQYLNKGGNVIKYLSEAAYPIYIIHMGVLYLGAYLILPLSIPTPLKFILVNLFAFAGSFIFYESIIRRISLLRPLFGLKMKKSEQQSVEIAISK